MSRNKDAVSKGDALQRRIARYRRHRPQSLDQQIATLDTVLRHRDQLMLDGRAELADGAARIFLVAIVELAAMPAPHADAAREKVIALEKGVAAVVAPATVGGRHLGVLGAAITAINRESRRWGIPRTAPTTRLQ